MERSFSQNVTMNHSPSSVNALRARHGLVHLDPFLKSQPQSQSQPRCDSQPPSEIKGKLVEDIINEWTGELEGLSRSFMRHAAQLSAWDRHILSTRHSLLDLEGDLKKVRSRLCALGSSVQSPSITVLHAVALTVPLVLPNCGISTTTWDHKWLYIPLPKAMHYRKESTSSMHPF